MLVLTTVAPRMLFVWLGAWLLPVMLASLGRIGVLAWREGRRYERMRAPDPRRLRPDTSHG